MVLLETARLTLRQFSDTDIENLFQLDNDPDVMKFINGGTPTAREIIKQNILPTFLAYDPSNPEFGFWAAELKASGSFIGWFSFRLLEAKPRVISLGYRLHKHVWGKGLATEGVQELLLKGFSLWGVERVIATVYEENLPSQRVMEKVGMKLHRRFRLSVDLIANSDTSYSEKLELWDGDDLEYSLSRSDWFSDNQLIGD